MSCSCSAISSTISRSRSAPHASGGSWERTYDRQSRMTEPRHAIERVEERAPAAPLVGQRLAARGCQLVVPPSALAGLFNPPSLDQAGPLQPVQRRIQRRDLKTDCAAGTLFDQLRDLVAVPRPFLDEREDQHLGTALLQVARAHRCRHMSRSYIYGR